LIWTAPDHAAPSAASVSFATRVIASTAFFAIALPSVVCVPSMKSCGWKPSFATASTS
jgi:hypothetical protein